MGAITSSAAHEGLGWWSRLWRGPPRWWFHVVLVPPTGWLLWSTTLPGTELGALVLSLGALLVLALSWGVRVLTYAAYPDRRPRSRRWVLVAPALALAVMTALVVDLPLRARWALSRSAFEDAADRAGRSGQAPEQLLGPIGSYDVIAIEVVDGAVFFHVLGGGLVDDCGFARLPDGRVPDQFRRGELTTTDALGGGWSTYCASW